MRGYACGIQKTWADLGAYSFSTHYYRSRDNIPKSPLIDEPIELRILRRDGVHGKRGKEGARIYTPCDCQNRIKEVQRLPGA